MEKVKIDKMECRFPTLFKVMWMATAVWMVVGIANYCGHWLVPDKLDGFGMSVLFLFSISIFICFGKGVMALISQHGLLAIDKMTKKVALYSLLTSFVVLLIISIWEICGTADSHTNFTRNGASLSIPYEAICSIVGDIIGASLISISAVLFYWYVRMCFILFTGRIRRLGVEAAVAMIILVFLSNYAIDNILLNIIVVIVAAAFLFDLWTIADFKETPFSMSQLESMVLEDNKEEYGKNDV